MNPVVGNSKSCSWAGCEEPPSPNGTLMKCSVCKEALYCGEKCQRKDWSQHKIKCMSPEAKADQLDNAAIREVKYSMSRIVLLPKMLKFPQEIREIGKSNLLMRLQIQAPRGHPIRQAEEALLGKEIEIVGKLLEIEPEAKQLVQALLNALNKTNGVMDERRGLFLKEVEEVMDKCSILLQKERGLKEGMLELNMGLLTLLLREGARISRSANRMPQS